MHIRYRVFGLSMFIATLGSLEAQAPPSAPANSTDAKKAKVEGTVVNGLSKEPVRRANVMLMPAGRPQAGFGPEGPAGTLNATTDQEGKFVLLDVDPGRYTLSAQKGGFVRANYGARGGRGVGRASADPRMGTQIELTAGQSFGGARIELLPQGIIAGRVLDDEGEPVQGLPIQLLRYRYLQGKRQLVPSGGAQSDDRGEFRITNLPPGQVILQITPRSWGATPPVPSASEARLAYVTTYYPNVTELSQASKIDVTAGAELTGFDIRLQKARVTRIRGKVTDASGQPPKNFSISLMPKDSVFPGPMFPQGGGKGDGSFELRNVQPGAYTLLVQSGEGRSPRFHHETINVGNENIDDLPVRLGEPLTLKGQIVVKEGQVDITTIRLQLSSESGRMWGGMGQQKTNEDGTFTLEGVSPGKYRILLYLGNQEGVYVESIRYGDHEALGKQIDVTAGGAPITVTVTAGAGRVAGAVAEKGAPAAGATVLLIAADHSKRDSMTTKVSPTDQKGTFALKSVPPGEYLAFAFDEIEYGVWEDEEVFKKIESKGVRVAVQRNGSSSITLAPITLPQ